MLVYVFDAYTGLRGDNGLFYVLPTHLETCIYTQKYRKTITHTRSPSICVLFRTAVVARMSWRCQCWQGDSIFTSSQNVITSLFYCPRLSRGEGLWLALFHVVKPHTFGCMWTQIKSPGLNKQPHKLQFIICMAFIYSCQTNFLRAFYFAFFMPWYITRNKNTINRNVINQRQIKQI